MRIKMLVSMAGPTMRETGQIIEVDNAEAARLIAAGFAVPEKAPVETATIEPLEKAVIPEATTKSKPKSKNK